MESGSDRPGGDPQRGSHLLDRQVEVVVQDDDGALIDRQLAEAALELIAIVDQTEPATGRSIDRQEPDVGARRVRFASA